MGMNQNLYVLKKNFIIYLFTVLLMSLFIIICKSYSPPSSESSTYHGSKTSVGYPLFYNPETEQFYLKGVNRMIWPVIPLALAGVYFKLFGNYKIRYLMLAHFVVFIQILVLYIYKFDGKKRRCSISFQV
jgi:hypothetical protein